MKTLLLPGRLDGAGIASVPWTDCIEEPASDIDKIEK